MPKDPNQFPLSIKRTTAARLEKLKHPGQSWDGVIEELLNTINSNTEGKPIERDIQKENR